jgi:hypothetical protein
MKPKPDISILLPDEDAVRARREALVAELQPGGPRRQRPAGTHRLLVAVAALLVLGGGAALASGVFSADDIAIGAGVGCYERPSLQANAAIYVSAADPVAKCERTWREGAMTGGDSTKVPPLVACTAENRPVMVFPGAGDAVCERLGLVPLPSDYAPAGRAHARAYAALFELKSRGAPAPNSACPSPQAQVAFARDLLLTAYPDVPVSIEGGEPCAGGYEFAGEQADGIGVITVSMARGRAIYDARMRRRSIGEVQDVLDPIFGSPPRYRRARERCLDPAELAVAARRALARAGRHDVEVRVEDDEECVSLVARYTMCCETTRSGGDKRYLATIRTITRTRWRADRREARKWKRLREAAEEAEARGQAAPPPN